MSTRSKMTINKLVSKAAFPDINPAQYAIREAGRMLAIINVINVRTTSAIALTDPPPGEQKRHFKLLSCSPKISVWKRMTLMIPHIASGIPMLDLVQEGNLGLMKSVKSFAETPTGDFPAFAATCIEDAITKAYPKTK